MVYCYGAGLNWETYREFYFNVLPWHVLRSWFFKFSKIFETARPCWLVKSIYETCWHFIKYCIGCHIFHTLVGWINYFLKPTVSNLFFEIRVCSKSGSGSTKYVFGRNSWKGYIDVGESMVGFSMDHTIFRTENFRYLVWVWRDSWLKHHVT